jgi:hypothetical protein
MMDIIIQATGSMEAGMQFCMDNNAAISDQPAAGTVYTISAAAVALGSTGNLQYLMQNGITVGTLGAPPPTLLLSEDVGADLRSEDGTEIFVTEDSVV